MTERNEDKDIYVEIYIYRIIEKSKNSYFYTPETLTIEHNLM